MGTTRFQGSGILLATLLIGLGSACRGGQEGREDVAAPDTVAAVADANRLAAPAPDSVDQGAVRADLEAQGGTDVVGFAVLAPRAGSTAITVEIHGANSGYPYVAELVEGTCASPGAVVVELSELTAGETGDAEYHRTLDRSLLPPDGANRAVRVRGADAPAVVACGNLGAAGEATSGTGR